MHVKYLLLTAFPLITSAAPLGLSILADLLKGSSDGDIKVANGGPVGPGLSELVAIAEGILRKYGITKTYADTADFDAGLMAIAGGILGVNGKEGLIAAPGKLLGNSPPKSNNLDAANQKILPTDIYKPTLPAQEQDGVKFNNVDVVSFLPGVVDESWIFVFGGKETHFGTNDACFSLTGNLQLSGDPIKARCLSKDISGENKGSPEEEKKPLKEEKCPSLAVAGIAGGKVFVIKPGAPRFKAEMIVACWGTIPANLLPQEGNQQPASSSSTTLNMPSNTVDSSLPPPSVSAVLTPKYAILKFKGVFADD